LLLWIGKTPPGDLFDVMELFKRGGYYAGHRRAFFLPWQVTTDRFMKFLFPELPRYPNDYERNFKGMTSQR